MEVNMNGKNLNNTKAAKINRLKVKNRKTEEKCLQSTRTCHICLWPLIKHGKLIWVILHPVPERLVRQRNSKLVSEEVLEQVSEACVQRTFGQSATFWCRSRRSLWLHLGQRAREPFEHNTERGAGKRVPFPNCWWLPAGRVFSEHETSAPFLVGKADVSLFERVMNKRLGVTASVSKSESKPCSSLFSLEQSTLMYCISSMSCTSTLSSEHTVSSCSLRTYKNKKSQISTLFNLKAQQSWNGMTAYHFLKILLTLYFCTTYIKLATWHLFFYFLFISCM